MKIIFSLFLIFIVLNVSAQKIIRSEKVTDHSTHVIGNNFEGVLFTEEFHGSYPHHKGDTLTNKWFTPSLDEIILVETVLQAQLKNQTPKAKYNDARIVAGRLKKYYRQYVGYINRKGEKCIYINGLLKESVKEFYTSRRPYGGGDEVSLLYDDLVDVMDGGNEFWNAVINLETKQIITFYANGVA